MSSDIVLTAALRNNLLSLQNTQSLIDKTQLRLATGLKVSSALDNPSNFFAAQALSNRSSDLTRLLDSINLSLRTIEEADKGVTALTDLLEQANSIAESARDELASTTAGARMVGNVDLRNVATLVGFQANIAANDVIRITTTNDAGAQIVDTFSIVAGESASALMSRITDTYADTRSGEVIAKLNESGFIDITTKDGRSFKIQDNVGTGATTITTAGFAALGLDRYFEDEVRGAGTFSAGTVVGGNTAATISLYEAAGGSNLADRGDILSQTTYYGVNGNVVIQGLSTNSKFNFTINNSGTATTSAIALTAATSWQDLVEQVNQTAAINTLVQANFDDATGQFSLTAIADSVENVQIGITTGAAGVIWDVGMGDSTGNLDPFITAATTAGTYEQVISFNSSTETLDNLASDYNEIRSQIDDLVKDAQFQGVNLLNGDDLTTYFSEDRTSSLVTSGDTFTANGLGISLATFRTGSAITTDLANITDAQEVVRSFGSSLANSLAIIQTRKNFTANTINVLNSGADDLTVADQNEEGANLLALQTRQALGVTSLSLASQSQQSVLRLF